MTATAPDDTLDLLDAARGLLPVLEPGPGLDWRLLGLCRQVDPDKWFPEKGASVKDAKRICQSCPVRLQCLEYALENDERFGVWGGLSERERRRLKRDRRQAADPDLADLLQAS
jgi:WhiB family redox-sensing transcriptional regulator